MATKSRIAHNHPPSRSLVFALLLAAGVCAALFPSSAVVFAAGMMPTIAALLIDKDHKKSITVTVGLMNAAGVIPFVVELWKKGRTLQQGIDIISQPNVWLFMYGAAAMGWLIVYSVPAVISGILTHRAKARLDDIERHQQDLVQLWGEDVRTRGPIHKHK